MADNNNVDPKTAEVFKILLKGRRSGISFLDENKYTAKPIITGTGGELTGTTLDDFAKIFATPEYWADEDKGTPVKERKSLRPSKNTSDINKIGRFYPAEHIQQPQQTQYIKTHGKHDVPSSFLIATNIQVVFSVYDMHTMSVSAGAVVYCLEHQKFYQAEGDKIIPGIRTPVSLDQFSVHWQEVYVDPISRAITKISSFEVPEPDLTEEQKLKYQEFENLLLLQATPGRLDQEDKLEKQEDDNEEISGRAESSPPDPGNSGAWGD